MKSKSSIMVIFQGSTASLAIHAIQQGQLQRLYAKIKTFVTILQ